MALAIVAIALMAGLQASSALARNALRQSDVMLAQLCAENALTQLRLSRQMPTVGDSATTCEQAARAFELKISVRPTPNPQFRRVDARVGYDGVQLLQLSTVVTHN